VSVNGTTAYSIRANPFTNAFLRMDGTNVTKFEGSGSGVVNCQFYPAGQSPNGATSYELFKVIPLPSFIGPF
jgi:phospholipase C